MAEFYRSRLNKKDDEEITRKTVVLGVLTVLIFLALVVLGLPLLIRFSILLGEAKSRRDVEKKEKTLPPMTPRLVLPFEATNSARLVIRGFAEKGVQVELLKNDSSVSKVATNDVGEFIFEDVLLNSGENVFSAIAISDERGSSEPSARSNLVFDESPPELVMLNPSEEKLAIDYSDFDVAGKSEPGVSVTINGRVAVVDDEGRFKLKFQLSAGKNNVEIIVRDTAGNETKKTIEITYDI